MTNEQVVETQDLAFKAVGDYVKAKNIATGLTKQAHAGAMVHALVDAGVLSDEDKFKAWVILCRLENGSQLRQELEKANILGKSVSIASQYAP